MRLHALRKMKPDIDRKTWFKAIGVWWLIVGAIIGLGVLLGFMEKAYPCGSQSPEPIRIKVRL